MACGGDVERSRVHRRVHGWRYDGYAYGAGYYAGGAMTITPLAPGDPYMRLVTGHGGGVIRDRAPCAGLAIDGEFVPATEVRRLLRSIGKPMKISGER